MARAGALGRGVTGSVPALSEMGSRGVSGALLLLGAATQGRENRGVRIYDGISELVGRTPLVRLSRLERKYSLTAPLLAKLEVFNPTGSVKDRIALSMIVAAERDGRLKPGGTIVEATSGNTGIGLAALAAARGYRAILVMPDNMSSERIQILKGFGAEVVLTPAGLFMPGAGAKAAEIAASIPGAFVPGQSANPDNPRAHRDGTGPEIWADTEGRVDVFVSAIGTGGTITGAGQYLKAKNPGIHVVGVEPSASAVLSGRAPGVHGIQGIGGGVVPPVLDRAVYDEVVTVDDADAFRLARELAATEGIFVGPSAGAALWSAIQVLSRPERRGKSAVVIVPDSGERYLSAGIFDDTPAEPIDGEAAGQSRLAEGSARAADQASVRDWTAAEIHPAGQFVRQESRFTKPFGEGEGALPVQAGRYRLIWSEACPWAHRSVIVRRLLGLDAALSLGTVDPIRPDRRESDWAFTLDPGGRDPVLGVAFVSDLYRRADPDYRGRFTVPAVVDIETGQVVNNDYAKLTRYWELEWRSHHRAGAPDLYPQELREAIDDLNDVLFREVNDGVYRCGFARSQEAYETAFATLFRRLDQLDERLSDRRFLFGDFVTDSDVRLFVTLARFDVAYYDGFRANRNRLIDFPHLWAYARDLWRTPGFGDTTNFGAIKTHYHLCAVRGNPFRLVPKGPDLSGWREDPGREALSREPGRIFREAR